MHLSKLLSISGLACMLVAGTALANTITFIPNHPNYRGQNAQINFLTQEDSPCTSSNDGGPLTCNTDGAGNISQSAVLYVTTFNSDGSSQDNPIGTLNIKKPTSGPNFTLSFDGGWDTPAIITLSTDKWVGTNPVVNLNVTIK
jgi:hypothetical protein